MRILFFSNIPIVGNTKDGYNGGGWISSLITQLSHSNNIEMAVGFFGNNDKTSKHDNITFYEISRCSNSLLQKLKRKISLLSSKHLDAEKKTWSTYDGKLLKIVESFKPDIIHIFGSEQQFGLIANRTNIPLVLHIQGIINPYFNALYPPSFSQPFGLKHRIKHHIWEQDCLREKEILSRVHNYIGRTAWDKRVTSIFNKTANYFYGGETLRDVFYEKCSRQIPQKLTIVSTISDPYYKGYDLILKTANLMKRQLELDFEWIVFGNVDPQYIEKKVGIKHEQVNVNLAGVTDASNLKKQISNSTLFVHPSYIDNSPNSVCEAQLLGSTVIAANVGGLPSLIENSVNGFLVPANDPYQLAYLIQELYSDPDLNISIGQKAKEIALQRHDQKKISDNLLDIYSKLLKTNS